MPSAQRGSTSPLRFPAGALGVLFLIALPAEVLPQPASARAPGEWSVGLEASWRAASTGLDDALLAAGFEWGISGFLGGDPGPGDPEGSLVIALRVGVVDGVVVSGLFDARRSLVVATGWKGLANLGIEPRLGLWAALASVETRNRVRIGLGPALYRTEIVVSRFQPLTDVEMVDDTFRESNVGLVLEAGIELPPTRRVFLDATAQYRWASNVTVGPYEAVGFPSTELTLAHWSFGIGLGFRGSKR